MDIVKCSIRSMADSSSTDSDNDGFKSDVKHAAECVSRISAAMTKADGAANSALAVVALATKDATKEAMTGL